MTTQAEGRVHGHSVRATKGRIEQVQAPFQQDGNVAGFCLH